MSDELKPCQNPPRTSLPLVGYYGGKPTRFVIEYDDQSTTCIGNADGSVDNIVASLTASTDTEWRALCEKLVGALKIAQEAAECFPDVHDGRVEPLQIIEHLHEWEAKYITFGSVAGAEQALAEAKLRGVV